MSTTYYANRKLRLLGCHTCSKCQSIIANEFSIEITGISSLTQNIATNSANEATNKILQALQVFPEKPFLVTETIDNRTLYTRHIIEIDGANRVCPFCGNREKWQWDYSYAPACKLDATTGVRLVTDVPEESRMYVFSSANEATDYASSILSLKREECRQNWIRNTDEQQRIQDLIENLKSHVLDLESQQKMIKAKSDFLLEQIQKKETEMKIYSLFSSERKIAKAELKLLKVQYTNQHNDDLTRDNELSRQIESTKEQIKTLFIKNPGVMDETEIIDAPNTKLQIAYRFS